MSLAAAPYERPVLGQYSRAGLLAAFPAWEAVVAVLLAMALTGAPVPDPSGYAFAVFVPVVLLRTAKGVDGGARILIFAGVTAFGLAMTAEDVRAYGDLNWKLTRWHLPLAACFALLPRRESWALALTLGLGALYVWSLDLPWMRDLTIGAPALEDGWQVRVSHRLAEPIALLAIWLAQDRLRRAGVSALRWTLPILGLFLAFAAFDPGGTTVVSLAVMALALALPWHKARIPLALLLPVMIFDLEIVRDYARLRDLIPPGAETRTVMLLPGLAAGAVLAFAYQRRLTARDPLRLAVAILALAPLPWIATGVAAEVFAIDLEGSTLLFPLSVLVMALPWAVALRWSLALERRVEAPRPEATAAIFD